MPQSPNESFHETIKENEFDLHEKESLGGENVHKNGFTLSKTLFDTEIEDNLEMTCYTSRY